MEQTKSQYNIPKLNLFEMIDFFAGLQSYLGSSIPLSTALTNIRKHSDSPKLKRIAKCLLYELDHGVDFSKAILKFQQPLGKIYCDLLSVGSESGTLPEISKNIYLALKKQRTTLLNLLTHLAYPAFMFVCLIGAVMLYLFFIAPRLASQYSTITGDSPTAYMVQTGNIAAFVGNNMIFIIIAVIFVTWGIISGFKYLLKSEAGVKFPVMGKILKYYNLSLFTRLFSIAYAAGMPITNAMRLSCETVQNEFIKKKLTKCATYISRNPLSETLIGTGLFTPEMIAKIQIGEEAGKLDERLADISDDIDELLTAVTVSALKLIEPLMLILVGGGVAFIGVSIMKSVFYV